MRSNLEYWGGDWKAHPIKVLDIGSYDVNGSLKVLIEDPWELNNLAAKVGFAKIKAELGKQLDSWMKQQGDAGVATELLANERQGQRKQAAKSKRKKSKTTQ